MTYEEKYRKLREAALELVGVPDDKAVLCAMLQELNTMGAGDDDNGAATMKFLVTLVELDKE